MNEEEFNEGCADLRILLNEVIDIYLRRDWNEHLKSVRMNEDDVSTFECMQDDVSRVWRLIEWHDNLRSEKMVLEDFLLYHKRCSDDDEWDLDDKDYKLINDYFKHMDEEENRMEKEEDERCRRLAEVSSMFTDGF